MAALRIVLDGHHVTMGPPLGLPYLHVVILPRHKRPSYQRHYNAALSTSAWVWTGVRQAISPLGRRATTTLDDVAVGLQR